MRVGRRGFIGAIAAAVAGLAAAPVRPSITPIFTEPVMTGAVGEFEAYIVWQAEIYCAVPRHCRMLYGISAGE